MSKKKPLAVAYHDGAIYVGSVGAQGQLLSDMAEVTGQALYAVAQLLRQINAPLRIVTPEGEVALILAEGERYETVPTSTGDC